MQLDQLALKKLQQIQTQNPHKKPSTKPLKTTPQITVKYTECHRSIILP